MDFKKISAADAERFESYKGNGEFSCENSFITQLIWSGLYNNSFAEENGIFYIRSGSGDNEVFSIPFGEVKAGVLRLREEYGKDICFWAQEGVRLDAFCAAFADEYIISEERDAADYIYSRASLAALSGKKYHSKRNHISAFSKKYAWHYEKITAENIAAVKSCAKNWYLENSDRSSASLKAERAGVELLLDKFEELPVRGGAIFCDGKAVAFTIGSPISGDTFDIHIEKALSGYAEAYTVINREFAANELLGYEWINREDDMGLEGLRRAKLSYHPERLLRKFNIIPR